MQGSGLGCEGRTGNTAVEIAVSMIDIAHTCARGLDESNLLKAISQWYASFSTASIVNGRACTNISPLLVSKKGKHTCVKLHCHCREETCAQQCLI